MSPDNSIKAMKVPGACPQAGSPGRQYRWQSARVRHRLLIVYHGQDSQLTQLVHNSSNSRPKWKLEGLSAGEQYTARLVWA